MNCLYLPRRISKVTRQNLGELPRSLVQHLTDAVTKTNKETKRFVSKIKECVLKAWWLGKETVSHKRTVTQTIRQSKWCWKVFGKTKALAWIVRTCFILRAAEKTGVKLWSSGKPVTRARLKPKLLYKPIKNTGNPANEPLRTWSQSREAKAQGKHVRAGLDRFHSWLVEKKAAVNQPISFSGNIKPNWD